MNARYFFVKDHIQSGELDIKYCPAEGMLAEFFTNPLQGTVF